MSQKVPECTKLAFLSSKIEKKILGAGHSPSLDPSPGGERGHTLPTPYLLGAFGASMLAPTALDSTSTPPFAPSHTFWICPWIQSETADFARCRHLANSTKHNVSSFILAYYIQSVIIKTCRHPQNRNYINIALLSEKGRATVKGNMFSYRKFHKIWPIGF